MASIIKSIAFKNFYNFFGEFSDNTFQFSEGLNIINADNGMGKSKMYNGFLWIIKDMVYDSDERKMDGVVHAALKIASEKAKTLSNVVDFGVKLVFEDERSEYTITKSITIHKTGEGDNGWQASLPNVVVAEKNLITHSSAFVYDVDKQEEIITNRLLAPTMQSYSLLQGEAIDNIVDLTDSKNLSQTVEALTDLSEIKVIEKTCAQLFKSANKDLEAKQGACTQNKKGFEEAQEEKKSIQQQIDNALLSIDVYKKQLQQANEEASKYSNILANTEKRVKYREELRGLKAAEKAKEEELNQLLSGINDNLFKKPLPWLLYGTDGYVDSFSEKRLAYVEKMLAKKVMGNPQALLASILPEGSPDDVSLSKMLDQCMCFVCNRPFTKGDEHYKHIEMLRNRSAQQPTTEDAKFKSFFDDIQKSVSQYIQVDAIFGMMADSIKEQKKIQDEIKRIKEKIKTTVAEFKNYGGTDSDDEGDSDQNVLDAYNKALNDSNLFDGYLRSATEQLNKLNDKLANCEKRLSEYGGAAVPQSYRDLKEIMGDIDGIFERTKKRIYDEVISALESKSNDFYQTLTSGNNVDGGRLSFSKTSYDSIQLKVYNEIGGELTGASEGFQRMKKIAVLMAIISSKFGGGHYDYPFIADAPFSAFGKNFINNFFDAVPSVFRQCIIMIKDLYDINSPNLLTKDGDAILQKMKANELPGTFYVISVPEVSDPVNMTTEIHPYKKCYNE